MRNYFAVWLQAALVCSLPIGMWGCVDDGGGDCPSPEPPPEPPAGAVYHEGVGAWIVPQNDPYALENFERARKNLAAGDPTRSGELSRSLEATHYALRIFPRNEDEQWAVELMEDVEVSYIPFDYAGLTEEEAQELEASATRASERPVFTDASPYVVVEDEIQQTVDEGAAESVSQIMPILYAVWPVGKPLPEELDYEMDYEVFLPSGEARTRSAAASGGNTLRLLENEAIRLALGRPASRAAATRSGDVVLSGEFEMWEVLREVRVPIPRIKVKFHLGSNIVETDADENGYFSITADSIPADASWDIVFQNPKWKVTRENSTIPKNFFQGDVYQEVFWSETHTHIRTTVQPADATILNALNYYYYTTHNLTKWEIAGGIRVIAHNESSSGYNGLFTYTGSGSCYITIYRNNTVERNLLAGTVLHEIGHFIQFKERGGYNNMRVVDKLLQESFASYVGWYLTEKYYEELGYVKNPGQDISGQDRQFSWERTTSGALGYYSPLFIDLADDFDQGIYSTSYRKYNRDEIKGLHYGIVMKIAKESANWASCKSILRENETLSGQSWDDFLAPYDDWYGSAGNFSK